MCSKSGNTDLLAIVSRVRYVARGIKYNWLLLCGRASVALVSDACMWRFLDPKNEG